MNKGLPSRVAVVGLGHVGLPLAAAFGRVIPTIGYDIDSQHIRQLRNGYDCNGETSREEIMAPYVTFTDDPRALVRADFIIVSVPTTMDKAKSPNLSHLLEASCLVAQGLKARALESDVRNQQPIVVYESTVYPGCTEEVCIPTLERVSGLKAGQDFQVGYSPERINPGDQEHTLEKVVKVVAAQDQGTLEVIAAVYGLVVKAGVYKAPDLRTAEAAKVIENVQRDLNIALVNELSMLFHSLGLDTREVLNTARTKWNFLPFEPGLVGGNCIPEAPYYLTHKAQEVGYHPEIILAGRRINDAMYAYIAREAVKLLTQAGKAVPGARVLVLGVTFKENVRDVRNSRVVDLVRELENYGCRVFVYDPVTDPEPLETLGLKVTGDPFGSDECYDAVVLAVPHKAFREEKLEAYLGLLNNESGPGVLVDVKGALLKEAKSNSRILYWSL